MKKRPESGVLASVHKTAAGLQRAGLLDKVTLREFDALCTGLVEQQKPKGVGAIPKRE